MADSDFDATDKALAVLPPSPIFIQLRDTFRVSRDKAKEFAAAAEQFELVSTLDGISDMVDSMQNPITWTDAPEMRAEAPPGHCDAMLERLTSAINSITTAVEAYSRGELSGDQMQMAVMAAGLGIDGPLIDNE